MPIVETLAVPLHRFVGDDGAERTKWLQCGRIIENSSGAKSLKLDCIPTFTVSMAGEEVPFVGWFNVFPYNAKDGERDSNATKKKTPKPSRKPKPYRGGRVTIEPAKDFAPRSQDADPNDDIPF